MRKLLGIIAVLSLCFILVGCASRYVPEEDLNPGEYSEVMLYATNRKIIYSVDMGIQSKKLMPVYDEILMMLNTDEWVESQSIGSRSGQLVLRIKTSRLLSFTDELRDQFDVTYFNHQSLDVSVNYYSNETRIEALEAEQARLIELFDEATISEQIQINQRLSVIESELRSLTQANLETDSLIEYSQVTIRLNSSAPYDTLTFGQKIKRAFFGGIDTFVTLIEYLILTFLALIPFLVVGIPSILALLHFNKKRYQKRLAIRNQQRRP